MRWGCAARVASTACPAATTSERWRSDSEGKGKLFQTIVFENLRSDLSLPPTADCHAMNMEEEMTEKRRPKGSLAVNVASPAMTAGSTRRTG